MASCAFSPAAPTARLMNADLLRTTGSAAELVVRQGRSLVSTLAWTPTPTNLRLLAARREDGVAMTKVYTFDEIRRKEAAI